MNEISYLDCVIVETQVCWAGSLGLGAVGSWRVVAMFTWGMMGQTLGLLRKSARETKQRATMEAKRPTLARLSAASCSPLFPSPGMCLWLMLLDSVFLSADLDSSSAFWTSGLACWYVWRTRKEKRGEVRLWEQGQGRGCCSRTEPGEPLPVRRSTTRTKRWY